MQAFDFFFDMEDQYGESFTLPDVVNMSDSDRFPTRPAYSEWRALMDNVLLLGMVHINSAGNDGDKLNDTPVCNQGDPAVSGHPIPYNVATPANVPPPWLHPDQPLPVDSGATAGIAHVSAVTTVGAVNANDVVYGYSSRGPSAWEDIEQEFPCQHPMPDTLYDYPYDYANPTQVSGLIKPDVVAPSEDQPVPDPGGLHTTTIGGGYSVFGGTSAATPHVAGTVLLMKQVNPDLTPAQVSEALQRSAVELGDPGKDNDYGAGRIDAYAAVQYVLENFGGRLPQDFVIPEGETWDFGNVTVEFESGAHLLVAGSLEADSTTFTARDPQQPWGGIVVFDSGALDLDSTATVSYADIGVEVLSTDVTIADSDIHGNRVGIESGFVADYCPTYPDCPSGPNPVRSVFTLTDSTSVHDNTEAGIRALNTNAIITDTEITDNGTSTANTHVGLGVSNADILTFERNIVEGSGSFGVAIITGGDIQMSPLGPDEYGTNRVVENGSAELLVHTGASAFLGSSTTDQNGRNSVYDATGTLVINNSGTTVDALNTYWNTLQDPSGSFAGVGSGTPGYTLVEWDPLSDCDYTVVPEQCLQARSDGAAGWTTDLASSPASRSGVEETQGTPSEGAEALGETIRSVRAALASDPTSAEAPSLVRRLGALHRRDRADALGEWAPTEVLLGTLRAPLALPGVSGTERATAEAALEVQTLAALAREDYAAAEALVADWAPRAEIASVGQVLSLSAAHLAARAGRYGEAAALAEAAAAEEPDTEVQMELRAVAAAYARRAGTEGGRSAAEAARPSAVGVATEASLEVYPNPTAGQATVAVEIPQQADLRLVVFDVLGRRVALLHDGPARAGRSSFPLRTAGLPSGLYVVRATSDGFAASRRLTVLR